MGIVQMPSTPQKLIPNRYHVVPRTIIFVFNNGKVLLQKGALDKKINAGLWNGLGGHIERNEHIISAAKRELFEESGINCDALVLCGTIMIDVNAEEGISLFVFGCQNENSNFEESSEGKLGWFSVNEIPDLEIVDDVPFLIEKVICTMKTGIQFHLLYTYDSSGNRNTTTN